MPEQLLGCYTLESLAKDAGFGDPKSRVWFVGLEENGYPGKWELSGSKEFNCEPTDEEQYYIRIWQIASKIMSGLNGQEDWRAYMETKLGRFNTPQPESAYLVKLFPFPRRKFDHWEESYSARLPEGIDNIDSYINWIIGARIRHLRKLREESRPSLTICWGSKHYMTYRWLFDLIEAPLEDNGIFYFKKERVAITPGFEYRRGFYIGMIDELVQNLKKLEAGEL